MMLLLAVCLVSSFAVIQSPRPTHAEGFLYRVTCVVGNYFLKICRDAPTEQVPAEQPPSSNPSTPANTPAQPNPAPASQQVTAQSVVVTNTSPPLELEEPEPLTAELPTIPLITDNAPPLVAYQFPSSALLSVYGGAQNDSSVLGADSSETPFLEATPQGWRLMGLLWYWWVLILGVVLGAFTFMRKTVTKTFPSIVK